MAKQIDMTEGKLAPLLVKFALPLMATNLLQMLFNVTDSLVISRYADKIALSAVGSNNALINLFLNLFIGISVAIGVITSQAIGAKDEKTQNKVSQLALGAGLLMGTGLAIIGSLTSPHIIRLLDCPQDVLPSASTYLRIYFWGSPFVIVYNFYASIIRATGDTKSPLKYLIISGFTNVILNFIFVAVFHIFVPGVAIATIISQAVSAFLVTRHVMRWDLPLKLVFENFTIDKTLLIKALKTGIPTGLQSMTFSFSNMIMQKGLNSLGTDAVAGSAAENNIESCVYVLLNSIALAGMNFVGQCYGAKKYKRLPQIIITCLSMQFLVSVLCAVLLIPNGYRLIGFFLPGQEEAIQFGMTKLVIVSSTYFLCGFMDTFVYTMRGIGITLSPFIIFFVSISMLRIGWVYTVFQKWHTAVGLYTVFPVSWIIPTIILAIQFSYIYKKRLLKELTR